METTMNTDLHGEAKPKFQAVRNAFAQGFDSGREAGARLCVIQGGEPVVDLWSGHTDRDRSLPWSEDTLVCCFSISKAITATCLLMAVDDGILELDTSIAHYWPEFASSGKERTTLRHVLSHQAGLPGFHEPVQKALYYDWQGVTTALAEEAPWWAPGSGHGYHARTFGFLLGEILRQVTGQSISEWLRNRITSPRHIDFHFQLDADQQARCADMIPAKVKPGDQSGWSPAMQRMAKDFLDRSTPTGAAFQNPAMGPGYMNKADFREALMPALNGHGHARSVAEFFAAIPELISAELLAEATRTQSVGPDRVLKSTTRFGLGYMLYEDESPIGWPGCFGHAGAGGSIAFLDPATQTAFAFTMNQMQEGVVTGGTTALACIQALQSCL